MSSFVSDCLYAFRIFYKRPGLTLLSILALAISLGLSTTTFSVLNSMFLKPLPFEKPEQLHYISLHNTKSDISMLPIPKQQVESLQQVDAFSDITGYYSGTINLSGDGRPERYNGAFVTPDFLDVLGHQPILGRSFSADAGAPGGPDEVLISQQVWETRFTGNPEVIGSTIRANGRPHQIIGVLPDGFNFPIKALVWVPIRSNGPAVGPAEPTHVQVLGRSVPGASPDLIQKQLDEVYRGWGSDSVEEKETLRLTSTKFGPFNWNDASQSLVLVMISAVIFILLISCANVANLLVGRALSRGREMAIRSALGATRKRILRQLLTESLVLSLCGSIGGLLYAAWAVDTSLKSSIWEIPYWMNFELDWRVFLFAFLIMLGTTLISGFVPAWQSSKIDLNEMLKDTSHTSTSFRLGRLTRLLAVIQIAFSCALLFGAGLVTRNVIEMKNLEPGFAAGEVLTMRMGLFPEDYPEESDRDAFYTRLVSEVSGIPGVSSSAVSSWIGQFGNYKEPFVLRGANTPPGELSYAYMESVSPGYFPTLGMQTLNGRLFNVDRKDEARREVVVNETFVRQFLGNGNPLGRELNLFTSKQFIPGPASEGWIIAGVVSDVRVSRFDKPEAPEAIIYMPFTETPSGFMSLMAHSDSISMDELEEAVTQVIGRLDPHLPVYFTQTMDTYIQDQILPYRMLSNFLLYIGLMALFLAAIGVYGMLAFNVSRRRREIGIRMALGANSRKIVAQVLRQGLIQVILGIGVGSALAYLVGQLTRNFLLGINPTDPSVFGGVLLTLVGVAILAFFLPARRAARLSPMDALRCE